MTTDSTLQVRFPNWLPFPGRRLQAPVEMEPAVDEHDLFAKAEIIRYYPNQGYGFLKNTRGEDIFFRVAELDLVGPKGHKKYLRVGRRVGIDVGWTSRGLHVSKMKVY